MVSTDTVKELRDKTGVSVMQCKRALEEAGGDIEQALVLLRKQAVQAAEKKANRVLGAGVVQSYIHTNNEVGSMVELSCETDFVSKNQTFIELARDIAMHVTAASPAYLNRENIPKEEAGTEKEVLLEQFFIKNPERTIQDLIQEAIQKFGEKVEITRFIRFSIKD